MIFFGHFWVVKIQQMVNVVGLVIGFTSFYFEALTPFWGIVFLYGAFHGIKSGKIALFFETSNKENPIFFWLLILLWGGFGAYFLLYAFY